MFDDGRSKRVVLVAHCLLNQNSISDGTADLPGQFSDITDLLMTKKVGLIQMPCPELLCLGLDRGDREGANRPLLLENTRIRKRLNDPEHKAALQSYVDDLIVQIREYRAHGFQVLAVIGVDRSPSCGINTTSKGGSERSGMGVFMELLSETLDERGIALPMVGTKTQDAERSLEDVRSIEGL